MKVNKKANYIKYFLLFLNSINFKPTYLLFPLFEIY